MGGTGGVRVADFTESTIDEAVLGWFENIGWQIGYDAVAAELLVSLAAMRAELRQDEAVPYVLSRLARSFKVSNLVILRRLLDAQAGSIVLDSMSRGRRKSDACAPSRKETAEEAISIGRPFSV